MYIYCMLSISFCWFLYLSKLLIQYADISHLIFIFCSSSPFISLFSLFVYFSICLCSYWNPIVYHSTSLWSISFSVLTYSTLLYSILFYSPLFSLIHSIIYTLSTSAFFLILFFTCTVHNFNCCQILRVHTCTHNYFLIFHSPIQDLFDPISTLKER